MKNWKNNYANESNIVVNLYDDDQNLRKPFSTARFASLQTNTFIDWMRDRVSFLLPRISNLFISQVKIVGNN